MADIVRTQGEALPNSMKSAWRDMGDGTHALERAMQAIVNGAVISVTNPLPVGDTWAIAVLVDREDNDIDKAWVVPVGYEYQILGVYVEYNAEGAVAGNRQIVVEWQNDSGYVFGEARAGAILTQGQARKFSFASSQADLVTFRDTDFLTTPIPPAVFLPAGYALRVYENNAVDLTDNMHVYVHIARRVV